MPRYNINGQWHYSDTDLTPDDLDALDKSSGNIPIAKPAVKSSLVPEESTYHKLTKGGLLDSSLSWRQRLSDLAFGPDKTPSGYPIIGGPNKEKSVLPDITQPETYAGGFARSLYDDFVKPLGTPSGFLGTMSPARVPGAGPKRLIGNPHAEMLSAVDKGLPIDPSPVAVNFTKEGPKNAALGLPALGQSSANSSGNGNPRFYAGEKGIADARSKYNIDTSGLPNTGELGTVLPREMGDINRINPADAPRIGTRIGDISKIETSSPKANIVGLDKVRNGSPIQLPKSDSPNYNIGDNRLPYQTESAPVQVKSKPQALDVSMPKTGSTTSPTELKSNDLVESYSNTTPSGAGSIKDRVKQWADGTVGATYRGKLAAEKFADLTDSKLIDAFESGDRSGKLKDLEAYFEAKHKQGVEAGLFKEDQKVPNYIRHEYDNSEDEIRAAMKQYVAQKSSISKTRGFPTYADAEAKGLTRKYQTIPELVDAYETKFNRALKNKQFYDYLKGTDQIVGSISDKPESWTFRGPNAPELKKLVSNVLGKSPEGLKLAGDAASVTKNIYLSGGIPGTKYNMHQWNIAKNDMALNGYWSGIKKLFSDPTGKSSVQWMKNLPDTEKNTLADLVDSGWQGHPMADTGKDVNFFSKLADKTGDTIPGKATGRVLDMAGKVLDLGQHAFEDPLFKRALPALGAQRTLEAFHKLEPQIGRENALKAAAEIGNNFYGGVDTVLRNPVNKDLSRIAFLAPNWMESQLTKAVNQWKGVGKVITGKASPVDKIYAKSFARGSILPGVGSITGGAVLSSRGGDIGAIHMGRDENDKDRTFPTLTTANEEFRLPVTAPIQMYMGNPAALKDLLIKNRISTPAKTIMNLVKGEDDFGNSLANKDKFGQEISFGKGLANYANEASRPFQHQAIQSLVGYLQGKMSKEEAIAKGLELPLAYSKPR